LYWQLFRLDLCYAWKFYDDLVAQQVLEALKLQTYARKKRSTWDTSVMFKGSAFTLKFYHKGAEFFAHDWKEIKKTNIDRANDLLNVARGVVRFEITLRHEQIMDIFKVPKDSINICSLLTRDTILNILRGEMKKLLKLDSDSTPLSEAYAKIFASYRPTPASKLFAFYRMFTSSDPYDRASVLGLPKSTRQRSLAKVRHLRLGIPAYVPNSPTSLVIPSEYSVGEFRPRSNTGDTSHFWDF
jgi:II/X family phage/plasmid replication protein